MTDETPSRYYLNCNEHLLNAIPEGLDRVFEFGCSGGMLGKRYKESNDQVVWHGADIHKPAVDYAKDNIDAAWCLDANQLKPKKTMLQKPYDALIYGDVIEHLIDPEQSLPDHLELLADDGKVVICIPNVQHWGNVRHLLAGNWEYRDSGLLDRTHLRFYTRKSFNVMLNNVGLEAEKMVRISHENKHPFNKAAGLRVKLLNSLEQLCRENNLHYSEFDFRTFQYVFVAKKISK
jgi:2-polyprenyl-3-methyl-5-hydroxy-6-metoxy-1,4-benzoquinol methylase